MQTQDIDTIVAIATAPGRGGVGILRLSGPEAEVICQRITRRLPEPRKAELATFCDQGGNPVDSGLVLRFVAPASFTGEDVVELHGHGSPVSLARLLEIAVSLGARLANPGEFSERAYLNGKLDLAQAEAIADLINAASTAAASAAMRSLRGEFSKLVHGLNERLLRLRVQVEAAIDFVDEDIELLADPLIAQAITELGQDLANIKAQARTGVRLSEGAKLVLLGAPNVGKSSLLNRLCGDNRAIVSEQPGTTRDVLREHISLAGIPIELIDTAGLRSSANQIEAEGIRRAQAQAVAADLVLAVYAANEPASRAFAAEFFVAEAVGHKVVWVANKVDLGVEHVTGQNDDVFVSALTGEGIEALTERLAGTLGVGDTLAAGVFSARSRHLVALEEAASAIVMAQQGIAAGIGAELVAEQLRYAQEALGSICGEVSTDELLGEIFAGFCIGK